MPIRASEVHRYPATWQDIRARILARAGNACEGSPRYPWCRARNGEVHPETRSFVVLTIAHLDHQPEHCADENLRAWCQRCHLTYDAAHHARNAARTRRAARRNGELFPEPRL